MYNMIKINTVNISVAALFLKTLRSNTLHYVVDVTLRCEMLHYVVRRYTTL